MDVVLASAPIDQVQHWPLFGQIGMVVALSVIGAGFNHFNKEKDSAIGWLFYIAAFLLTMNIFFG